jgi:hypothetical protein
MPVELIGCTAIAWDKFTSSCVKEFGRSPTRELDKKNIRVGDVLSWAYSLEILLGNTNVINSPSKLNRSLDFINLVFQISFDDGDVGVSFINLADFDILHFPLRSKCTQIICGTLRDFKNLVNTTTKEQPEEIRRVNNDIYKFIEQLGFVGLCGFKEHLIDKTFILKGSA